MNKSNGFSLIELMVVVAIIGILAAIALPQYSTYVTRSKFADATSGLASKRVRLEQSFQDNRTYVGATDCNSDTATSQYFTFSCSAATATAFTLQAVGRSSMAGFTFTINESGTRATTVTATGWTGNTGCWITNKGGAC